MAQPEVRAIPRRCSPARAPSSPPRSATTRPSPSGRRATAACRATRGTTRYAELREKLDALGRELGGSYRVLVDANQHVDREAAARSGVGFYGKNTMLITRRHGSWVVLGTLVTDVELEPTPPLELDCGSCRLCIDACPTGALDEPGTLDATRCLSYWTQAPAAIPEPYRDAARRAGLRLRHLPGRLPVEPRRREAPRRRRRRRRARSRTSRFVDWLARRRRRSSRALRPALRAAQRRALAAPQRARRAGNVGGDGRARRRAEPYLDARRRRCCASTRRGR